MTRLYRIEGCTLLFASLALAVLSTNRASAAGAPISLVWKTPPDSDCPSTSDVLGQIDQLLGGQPVEGRSTIQASADVRRDDAGRWSVDLVTQLGDARGHRVISERSCRAMAEATVIILAWMIDPDRMASRAEAPAAPAEPPKPAPATVVTRNPDPGPTREPRTTRVEVRPEVVGDWGTLPSFAFGIGARAGLAVGVVRVGPYLALWPSRSTTIATAADGSAMGANLWLGAAGIDACVAPTRLTIAACGGAELDRLAGTGFGVRYPTSTSATWLAFRAGLDAQLVLSGPFRLAVTTSLLVPTRRSRFGIDDVGDVDRPSQVSLRASLGFSLEL